MRKTCPMCSGAVQQQALGRLSAEDAPLKLTAEGMPAVLWLIQELKERETALPAGTESGMIFKKYLCACGKELASKSERRQAFAQELVCGKDQLRSTKEVQKHTSLAVAALNDAAKFPHSG